MKRRIEAFVAIVIATLAASCDGDQPPTRGQAVEAVRAQGEKLEAKKEELRTKGAELGETFKGKLEHVGQRLDRPEPGEDAPPTLRLSDEAFEAKMRRDLATIRRYDAGLERTLTHARTRPELFPWGWEGKDATLTSAQRDELRQIWAVVLDYMRALDDIKQSWRDFHRINPMRQPLRHAAAFLIGYTAWMVQYHHGLDFMDMTVPSKPMELILDESSTRWDIPSGAFGDLKWNILHVKAVGKFLGSRRYYELQRDIIGEGPCRERPQCVWALERIEAHHQATKHQLASRAAIQFGYNSFDIARDFGFEAWFPLQRGVAEWMGDTKTRRPGEYLIQDELLRELGARLEPGDVLVTRKNWYLSNIGLPGFWPHAELYIGSPEEMAGLDTPEATEALPELGGQPLTKYLSQRYPRAWAAYLAPPGKGKDHRIIEAVSEGVVFSSLLEGGGADYLAALRPRRSAAERARAIVRAFEYWGRPYDFNFDFMTDETLVCTELVYKSWEPSPKHQGLRLDLVEVAGRSTLPANDLVRQFADQRALPPAQRQLEFVGFLEGREEQGQARMSTEEAFARSWERPKWDVVQP